MWVNNGKGRFFKSGINIGKANSLNVAMGDVDGDGDEEVFVVNFENWNEV